MTTTLISRVDTRLSPGNQSQAGPSPHSHRLPEPESVESPSTRRKRKASEPLVSKTNGPRQKITRACDHCKEKKTRCTGTLPCARCTRLSLPCEYNAAYSRGLPPEPPPAPPAVAAKYANGNVIPLASRAHRTSVPPQPARISPRDVAPAQQSFPRQRADVSDRNSPDPVATDFEGNYLGPASGVSFLNRVWRRLHQDELHAVPDSLPNESCAKNAPVYMFGDKPYMDYHDTGFTLPPFEKAKELVTIYFDFSMVTYRFLHRGSVETWLKQVYELNISSSNLPTGCMVSRTAIILMILAVGTLYEEQKPGHSTSSLRGSERWYAASKHMSSLESGPPRLETVQARLGQCLYLLSSSRANECWYAFGTALQLVTALGLHRKCPAKVSKNGNHSYLERELRKRIFWSAYTLDKYLSVMFGRPRLLHDEDTDQELPDEMNDDDMLEEDPKRRTGSADCMMIASVLHFRLGRILGEISRELYTVNPRSRDSPLDTAVHLVSELEKWRETAPPLFNGVRASSLIPPLCRQSQVLQLAYSHSMIHATRSFLLSDFTDLGRRPSIPHPTVTSHIRKCIEAAEDVMTLVESLGKQGVLIQSFWFTHYVCFCAITVVYIYTIQQYRLASSLQASSDVVEDTNRLQFLFSLGESCQQYLAEATRKNCPSRRYSIILEELRLEVHRQIGASLSGDLSGDSSGGVIPASLAGQETTAEQRPIDMSNPGLPGLLNAVPLSYTDGLQTDGLMTTQFEPDEDLGLLDNLDGSIWWTQLDSWAFSNLPNDTPNATLE
ncbi:fungal-specific transcription factor domain-containing protein [Aspergillus ambiguus]|uniref:Zn(II)2Cys6 transcription factor n=1 Tax=Aspergillus ambiguus TaxID=176160 RepID=UPI003CCCA180